MQFVILLFLTIFFGIIAKSFMSLLQSHNYKKAWQLKLKFQMNRFSYGLVSKEDLFQLLPRDFELWSAEFLKKLGYKIIEVTSERIDGGKDIIAEKDGQKVYVECKKFNYDIKEEHTEVSRDIVQKLVGAMVADKINYGIILTTGIVTDRSREYVKNLPSTINVELIDGDELANLYRIAREKEYQTSPA